MQSAAQTRQFINEYDDVKRKVVLEKYNKKMGDAAQYREKEALEKMEHLMEKRERAKDKQYRIREFQELQVEENEVERKYLTKVKD
mmetsp:Transcript_15095/g.10967  ORF Transcript_15095/g.10967 Transcript_15095/m.10967 type:complete len:86 (+) Transcript_15095:258-515(+)